jgi:hypothetical protein
METDLQRMAALMLGLKGAVVLDAREDESGLRINVELDEDDAICPVCGQPAAVWDVKTEEHQGLPVFGWLTRPNLRPTPSRR